MTPLSLCVFYNHADRWRYEWRRDDDPLDPAVSGRFSVDTTDQSLTIQNASSSTDTAIYTCLRRRRRSHGNRDANETASDDVVASRQIQLVVQGTVASPSELAPASV